MKALRLRRTIVLLLGAAALALPVVENAGTAAALAADRQVGTVKKVTYKGATVPAHQWGTVTVTVTQQTTTTGTKVTRRFSDLGGGYTYHTSRSQYIMSQALPLLRQEFLAAQTSKIQMVSGATYTSQAFIQSLQSALLKAHA